MDMDMLLQILFGGELLVACFADEGSDMKMGHLYVSF
jgi:hypothetical protein